MQIEEPEWIELDREENVEMFAEILAGFHAERGEPQLVLIVLRNENLYGKYKNICYRYNAPS